MPKPQADKIFRNAFRKHFANHEANFPPSRDLVLGDYGTFTGGYFSRLGNISDAPFRIRFGVLEDRVSNFEEFQSDGDVSVKSLVRGSAGSAITSRAALEFAFGSKSALYFSSAAVTYLQIDNLLQVGNAILKAHQSGRWNRKFMLVSRLIQGANTVIIISGSSGSKLRLEATSPQVRSLKLSDARAKFEIVSSSKVSYKSVANGISPIGFALSGVYNPLFHSPRFGATRRRSAATTLSHAVVFGDVAADADIPGVPA